MSAEAATAWRAVKSACRATTPKDIESTKATTAYGIPSRTPRTNDSLTARRLGDGYDTPPRWYRRTMDTMTHEVVEPRRASMAPSRAVALLGCALACLAVVAVFGLMVSQDRSPLDGFDRWGRQAEGWADDHATLVTVLRVVEVAFATFGMVIWTTLVVLAVASRRRFRAAAFAIAVMVAASFATTGIKLWLGRGRPEWQDAVDQLTSKSFPSGHASSSAALAGILILLAWSFLRRGRLRWLVTGVAVVVWVGTCLDRVLLGRHYPSDVVAGSFLGVAILLVGIVVFDPARVRPRDGGPSPGVDSSGRLAGRR
jgi:membrane-associated phospholipid phosphatase